MVNYLVYLEKIPFYYGLRYYQSSSEVRVERSQDVSRLLLRGEAKIGVLMQAKKTIEAITIQKSKKGPFEVYGSCILDITSHAVR